MEIGAIKQAFNNEIILLKKNLNQAKIQIIHKLTRRSKQFAEKKGPEKLKGKFKKKAESAINEVLIIKKIKVKDLAKFAVTHTGELKDFLNKPNVDHAKGCARLLLHKSLQEKYESMRSKYSNIEIKDLFMSRIERRKQKKEERESRKKKKNNKDSSAEGDLNVKDVAAKDTDDVSDRICSDSEESMGTNDEASGDESSEECFEKRNSFDKLNNESDSELGNEDEDMKAESESESQISNIGELEDNQKDLIEMKTQSNSEPDKEDSNYEQNPINFIVSHKNNRKLKENVLEKKQKDNKNKNLKKKLSSRNFNKDKNEDIGQTKMVADPFFITATGENYMSVVEKTETDELKQGNRRERRAAMFGYAPKIKSRSSNTIEDKNNKQNGFQKFRNAKFQTKTDLYSERSFRKADNKFEYGSEPEEKSEEKLHPSWAAKKKQSGLLPFQGKKIVFDAS